jgi:hypothetical protein
MKCYNSKYELNPSHDMDAMLPCGNVSRLQIYLLLNCVDESGDREVDLLELMTFFYRVSMFSNFFYTLLGQIL